MAKRTKKKPTGRQKGQSPEQVVMFNRYNLLYYTTIKGKTETGKPKIVGRDYSVHKETLDKNMKSFLRSSDTYTVKFLKAVKRCSWKQDILKTCPNLIVSVPVDLADTPIGTYYQEDTKSEIITDVHATLEKLETANINIQKRLFENGHAHVVEGLVKAWAELKDNPRPPAKAKDPKEIEKDQLALFSW
tara:strand:+ start:858 stop:1424 length:567 start_codon:yes stop_codon:yes gene_type:complete